MRERTTAEIELALQRRRLWEDAYRHREQWAKAHGCAGFKEVMSIGIQAVGRRIASDQDEAMQNVPRETNNPQAI